MDPSHPFGQMHPGSYNPSEVPPSSDWGAQQSLFMGSNGHDFSRPVSASPQDCIRSFHSSPPTPFQSQSSDTTSPYTGRIMYPSSNYQMGNPGFYYDSFQYPNCTASQVNFNTTARPFSPTTPVTSLLQDTYTPAHRTIQFHLRVLAVKTFHHLSTMFSLVPCLLARPRPPMWIIHLF